MGFDDFDDAGVFRLSDGQALVQTLDFFTPIVDDPYSYGQIAAANALSDVYAMGGKPLTAMNIACFDPESAPVEVWAKILAGMSDKVSESGAALVGGHTVEDKQPKFGLSVTGLVDYSEMFTNSGATVGQSIYLSKPLGTGIVTTAAKFDDCPENVLMEAIGSMTSLNDKAAEIARNSGSKCATDITGFGLAGHLYNVARASQVRIEIESLALPMFAGIQALVERGNITLGGKKNAEFLASALSFHDSVPEWKRSVIVDPQTSGGLAIFSSKEIVEFPKIGSVISGELGISVR